MKNVWLEIYNDSRGTYNTNSQIKFKTSMLRSSLCDYSDPYILASRTNSPKHRRSSKPKQYKKHNT